MPGPHRAACDRAIFEIYRTHVISHIRTCFRKHFESAPSAPLIALLGEQWQQTKETSEKRIDAHIIDARPEDDFDLLDVSHFYNIFDVHYDRLLVARGKRKRPEKGVLLGYMKIVTDFRNASAHPFEQDLSFNDAFRCLDTTRRFLMALEVYAPAKEIQRMMDGLRQHGSLLTDGMREPLLNNLPAAETVVTNFVGRETELNHLRTWLDNPERRRWALCGQGGTGKSSIAYRFGQEIVDRAPAFLRCVFWLSAKKRRFLEGATVSIRNPDFNDLNSALDHLALEYGKEKLMDLTLLTKKSAVLKLLHKIPALLIVDDIDSIEEVNSDVVEFFLNDVATVRGKTKVLFTSRESIFGMAAFKSEVGGLEDGEAGKFISSRAAQFGVAEELLTKQVVARIIEITGGSPLYMEDLVRLIQIIGPRDAMAAWAKRRGDEAREFALKREFEMLPEDARSLLMAACIQPLAISALEAKRVLQLSDGRFETAVERLRGLFLMYKPAIIKRELRYEVNENIRRLVLSVMEETDEFNRVKAAYAANAGVLTGKGRGEVRSIVRQAGLMVRDGLLEEAEELITKSMEGEGRKPVLLSELGWVYANWKPPRLADARIAFEESTELNKTSDDAFVRWCRLELETKEFTKACSVVQKGLKRFAASFGLNRLAGVAFGERANELVRYGQNESAKRAFERSTEYYWKTLELEHPSHINDREVDAALYRGLIRNFRFAGNWQQVLAVFNLWAERHPEDPTMAWEASRLLHQTDHLRPEDRQDLHSLLRGAMAQSATRPQNN